MSKTININVNIQTIESLIVHFRNEDTDGLRRMIADAERLLEEDEKQSVAEPVTASSALGGLEGPSVNLDEEDSVDLDEAGAVIPDAPVDLDAVDLDEAGAVIPDAPVDLDAVDLDEEDDEDCYDEEDDEDCYDEEDDEDDYEETWEDYYEEYADYEDDEDEEDSVDLDEEDLDEDAEDGSDEEGVVSLDEDTEDDSDEEGVVSLDEDTEDGSDEEGDDGIHLNKEASALRRHILCQREKASVDLDEDCRQEEAPDPFWACASPVANPACGEKIEGQSNMAANPDLYLERYNRLADLAAQEDEETGASDGYYEPSGCDGSVDLDEV